jgi:hypothetical protein
MKTCSIIILSKFWENARVFGELRMIAGGGVRSHTGLINYKHHLDHHVYHIVMTYFGFEYKILYLKHMPASGTPPAIP